MESEQPERRFSVGNGPRTYQLKSEIVHCKQKGEPVALYFRRLNKLWLELSQLDPPVDPCTNLGAEIERRREEERLDQFLMGLDHDNFVAVGSTVLNSQPSPSVHKAYSVVVREEEERAKRRTLTKSKPVPCSHVVAQDSTRIKRRKRRKASIPSKLNVELPEEIVTEILVRLPPKSLFRFSCVSKRWKSITSDPRFAPEYLKLGSNTRGMLYPYMEYKRHGPGMGYSGWSSTELFVPDHHRHRHRLLFYFRTTMRHNDRRILASSTGLVLSQVHTLDNREADGIGIYNGISFCVSNPLTKQNVILSKIIVPRNFQSDPMTMWPWTCGFATRATIDTNGSYNVSYRVVVVLPPADNTLKVEHHSSIVIFSSDSGSWKRVPGPISNIPAAVLVKGYRAQDFCYKGVLHWLDQGDGRRTIVTYDPYEECPNSFSHIRMPHDTSGGGQIMPSSLMSLVHSAHEEDFPRCCEIERCPGDSGLSLLVWRMEDYEKRLWCLEQRCAISPHCLPSLKGCRQLIAPGPQSPPGVFRHLFVSLKPYRVVAIDLGSGKEEDVAIGKIVSGSIHLYRPRCLTLPLVPFASCPWSSPNYYNCINRPKMRAPLPQLPLE